MSAHRATRVSSFVFHVWNPLPLLRDAYCSGRCTGNTAVTALLCVDRRTSAHARRSPLLLCAVSVCHTVGRFLACLACCSNPLLDRSLAVFFVTTPTLAFPRWASERCRPLSVSLPLPAFGAV